MLIQRQNESRTLQTQIDENSTYRYYPSFNPNTDTLVCFPYAGGSASIFHPYSDALTKHWELLVMQYSGREWRFRSPLKNSLSDMADEIAESLYGLDTSKMIFFGHSMGAKIAFEVAARLPLKPKLLITSCSPAPNFSPSNRPKNDYTDQTLSDYLKKLGGISSEALENKELMSIVLPIIRSDFQNLDQYSDTVTRTSINVPIVSLAGKEDSAVNREFVREWREWTNRDFFIKDVEGGHFYFQEQSPQTFAAHLNSILMSVSAT